MRPEAERNLVEGCRRGDRDAQRRLYDLTSEKIYRLMLGMTQHPDDAFDLTQEAYVRAFTQIGQFQEKSSLVTWLFRIAVNQALQFRWRASMSCEKLRVLSRHGEASFDDERHIVQLDVQGALATLDPDEQAVLLLRYQEGLSYQQMADVLGCAEGTVASRLNRARQQLKTRLQESYGPEEESDSAEHLYHKETDVVASHRHIGTRSDRLQR